MRYLRSTSAPRQRQQTADTRPLAQCVLTAAASKATSSRHIGDNQNSQGALPLPPHRNLDPHNKQTVAVVLGRQDLVPSAGFRIKIHWVETCARIARICFTFHGPFNSGWAAASGALKTPTSALSDSKNGIYVRFHPRNRVEGSIAARRGRWEPQRSGKRQAVRR